MSPSLSHLNTSNTPKEEEASIPNHIAIIMDGNGRWAAARHLARSEGHRAGVEAVHRTVSAAGKLGVRYLTLFGFSTENWRRPKSEVGALMRLLKEYLASQQNLRQLFEAGVRLQVIGDRGQLTQEIVHKIEEAEAYTAANEALVLTIALSYGSRQELVRAVRLLAQQIAQGELESQAIDETKLANMLYTAGLPDPDLLIRTSGEQRLSNFLLWQLAYSELVFLDVLWPDFDAQSLDYAISLYQQRERRYGGISAL
jgi:undecaprenyl diphosphate synthase